MKDYKSFTSCWTCITHHACQQWVKGNEYNKVLTSLVSKVGYCLILKLGENWWEKKDDNCRLYKELSSPHATLRAQKFIVYSLSSFGYCTQSANHYNQCYFHKCLNKLPMPRLSHVMKYKIEISETWIIILDAKLAYGAFTLDVKLVLNENLGGILGSTQC